MKEKTKKSFFFEDYTESEILFSNKKSNVRILRNRINFLFFIFISLAFICSIKIFHLSLYPAKDFSVQSNKNFISARSDITDRNGVILARNVDIFSAGIRPNLVNAPTVPTGTTGESNIDTAANLGRYMGSLDEYGMKFKKYSKTDIKVLMPEKI